MKKIIKYYWKTLKKTYINETLHPQINLLNYSVTFRHIAGQFTEAHKTKFQMYKIRKYPRIIHSILRKKIR
jgi:hypothetical protein